MTKVRQIARAAAVLLAFVGFIVPPRADASLSRPGLCTAPLIPESVPLAPYLPAVALTLSEEAMAEMCRNDPVNNFDPLGLETAYEKYYAPLGWFGRFEYGLLNIVSFGTLAKNDRLVERMERGEISPAQWKSASIGNGAVAVGQLGLMVGTGGGSTLASGARVGLSVGLTDVLGTRANYSGHAITYEQSVVSDAGQVLLAGAAFALAGYAGSLYQAPTAGAILDPTAIREYAGWVPEQAAKGGFVFRGTTRGYPGGGSGVTFTSTDPAVATVFAVQKRGLGPPVIEIARQADLAHVPRLPSTSPSLAKIEAEIVFDLSPTEYSRLATEVPLDDAVRALNSMGVRLPRDVPLSDLSSVLRELQRLNQSQIDQFLRAVAP